MALINIQIYGSDFPKHEKRFCKFRIKLYEANSKTFEFNYYSSKLKKSRKNLHLTDKFSYKAMKDYPMEIVDDQMELNSPNSKLKIAKLK